MSHHTPFELKASAEQAAHYARQALNGIMREYPNAPGQILNGLGDVAAPRTLHPAFYGCFDWHSAVHSHWLLVRVLRMFPTLPEAATIRAALNSNLATDNLLTEATYFDQPNHQTFERLYGWAWVLKLDLELSKWNDQDGQSWWQNLQPLTTIISSLFMKFLPKLTYPIRVGTHSNTAFSFIFALEFARHTADKELEDLLISRSLAYFGQDKAYPANWEPHGGDFLSPALTEADLLSQVLSPTNFERWFEDFLPNIASGEPAVLLNPVIISDLSDPSLGHLNGLYLSRAWSMLQIARSLPAQKAAQGVLIESAMRHAQLGLPQVVTDDYMGGHWMASFALYLQTRNDE